MRRWSLRILTGFLLLIVLIAVVVQLVLWSQLPKNVILPQIEKQLGLEIRAGKMTTGWLGYTTLTDVSVRLPLAEKSFLHVPTLKLKENSLFSLALTRNFALNYVEIDRPDVAVIQGSDGQWNLQQVAELLGKVGGGKEGTDTAGSSSGGEGGVPKLPNVRLLGGTITVLDNAHHSTKLSPLNVNGYAGGALVWNYEVSIGQSVALQGKVAPGGNWQHVLTLQAHHLDAMTGNFGVPTYGADLAATWNGALNGSKVDGTLRIDHAAVPDAPGGSLNAIGAIDIDVAGPVVTLNPRLLDVQTKQSLLPEAKVTAGTIVYDTAGLHLNGVQVSALGGAALVTGGFDPATTSGNLDARWSGLALTSGISHSGSLLASLKMPISGHPEMKVELNSHGTVSGGRWDTQIDVVGQGESWKSIDWLLTAPQLSYTGSQTVKFTNLIGHVTQRYPSIELTSLTLPERPHLTSGGKADLATRNWYFWMNTGGTPSIDGEPLPIDFFLNTWGTDRLFTLKELDLQISDRTLWAGGFYNRDRPKPVELDVALVQSHQLPPDAPVHGHVQGQAHLSGDFDKIAITGDLQSKDLVVLNHPVGDIGIHLEGSILGERDWRVYSTQFNVLQGRWKVLAHGPLSDNGIAELTVQMDDLPLDQVAALVNVPNVSGNVEHGQITLTVPQSPGLNSLQISNSGLQMRDLRYGTALAVDRADVIPSLSDGAVTLKIGASSNAGGYAGATVNYNLASPTQVTADYQVQSWVYPVGGSGAMATTAIATVPLSHVAVTLKPFAINTSLQSITDVKLGPATFAHAEADAQVAWPVFTLSNLNGRVLNGTFDGRVVFDATKPLQAVGQIHAYDIDAGAIVNILPDLTQQLQGLAGIYSATVTLGPAREPRPKEPVRIDVNASTEGAHFRSLQIGTRRMVAVHAVAYANTDRVILDTCNIDTAGGSVDVRARVDRGFSSADLLVGFHGLQLDQLAHVVPKLEDKPMPGLVDGTLHVISSGFDLSKMTGRLNATLTASDLGNFGPIAAVYNILHPGGGGGAQAPEGVGNIAISFEQNMLRVTDFHYFNRGIDAHGVFTVGPSLLDLPNTPVGGQVAGTAQPLGNTRLPFFGDFNDVFAALQSNLTTIDVTGTAAAPQYAPASLSDVGASLKELLVGSARADNGD